MNSSLDNLLRGCCGDTFVNFSLLRMPEVLFLNFSDLILWCAILVMFAEPFFKSMIGIQEKQKELFSHYFGQNLAFLTYITMSYSYSAWTFVLFHKSVVSQPRITDLQRNEVLVTGYLFVMAGLCIKLYTYFTTSLTTIMGGHYFKLRTAVGEADLLMHDPYYHPLGTASVMCYLGFSLIQASAAGFLLTVTLALAYYMAFHFERLLILKSMQQTGQQPPSYLTESPKRELHHRHVPFPIRAKRN